MISLYALTSWGPQLVKSLSSLNTNRMVGLLLAIPNLVALTVMIFVSRSSDRMPERRYHVAIPAIVGATALVLLGATRSPLQFPDAFMFISCGYLQLLRSFLVIAQRVSDPDLELRGKLIRGLGALREMLPGSFVKRKRARPAQLSLRRRQEPSYPIPLSPVDESACNPRPKSVRQTGRYPFNAGHNDLANDTP